MMMMKFVIAPQSLFAIFIRLLRRLQVFNSSLSSLFPIQSPALFFQRQDHYSLRPCYLPYTMQVPIIVTFNNLFPLRSCLCCCIRCGPDEEGIIYVLPGRTELVTLVKTGIRAGSTHSQKSRSRIYCSFIVQEYRVIAFTTEMYQ